jgi:hypothetical protein
LKAILIDPFNQTIIEHETDGELHSIYKLMQVSMIEAVYLNSSKDCMYVDEEGLLGNLLEQAWFRIEGFEDNPFAGRGLVFGTTDDGGNSSPRITVDQLRTLVVWCRLDVLKRQVVPV